MPAEMEFFVFSGDVVIAGDAFSADFTVAGFHRGLFPFVFHFDSPSGVAVRESHSRQQVLHCMWEVHSMTLYPAGHPAETFSAKKSASWSTL